MIHRLAQTAVVLFALATIVGTATAIAYGNEAATTAPSHTFDESARVVAAAGLGKVNICHSMGHGGFNLINVNEKALRAHENHGDIYPVPPEGCPGDVCAEINDLAATPFLFSTVTWSDGVNTTLSYTVEAGPGPAGPWTAYPAVLSEADADYSKLILLSPTWTDAYVRVVASCGIVSDVIQIY